jgi:hypothetical protein
MVAARKSAAKTPAFAVGDIVTVSERALPLRAASTQSVKLQQGYMGPYAVCRSSLAKARAELLYDFASSSHARPH